MREMLKVNTFHITADQFVSGEVFRDLARRQKNISRHACHAEWKDGKIEVKDAGGRVLEVQYAGSADNRTVTAYVAGVGFIGGWQYPHKKAPFKALVESINRGLLYGAAELLPRSDVRPPKNNRLAQAANAVLDKWGNGNMSEVMQELELAMRAAGYRQ